MKWAIANMKYNPLSWEDQQAEFKQLDGNVLESIEVLDDEIIFKVKDGFTYRMYHEQDCCESVIIESIVGDIEDLIGTPLLQVEEVSNQEDDDSDWGGSHTWTFYKMATIKGSVTIRWHGESNGYYSESVDFERIA